jgi:hypothetical protein
MASSTPQSQASMLATITTDLDNIAPRFEIQPEQITIIKTPTDFYETLKVGFDSTCHALFLFFFISSFSDGIASMILSWIALYSLRTFSILPVISYSQ